MYLWLRDVNITDMAYRMVKYQPFTFWKLGSDLRYIFSVQM